MDQEKIKRMKELDDGENGLLWNLTRKLAGSHISWLYPPKNMEGFKRNNPKSYEMLMLYYELEKEFQQLKAEYDEFKKQQNKEVVND